MNLYYILYPIIGLISIIGICINKEKLTFIVILLILTFFSIFRFDHGYDYFWYWIVGNKNLAKNFEVIRIYNELEYGIKKIYDIVRFLGNSQYFFIITGLVISILIYKLFFYESRNPLISIFLFLIIPMGFYDFNHYVMQSLAMSIIFYGTKYILSGRKNIFILLVLSVSFLFHSSSILALSFLFFPQKRIKNFQWIIGFIFLFIYFKYFFIKIVKYFFPKYTYILYFNPNLINANLINIKIFLLIYFGTIILLFINKIGKNKFFKLIVKERIKLNKREEYYYNLFIFGIFISILLAIIFPGDLSKRIGSYFLFFGFIVGGNFIETLSYKIKKNIKILFIILIVILKINILLKWQEPFILNKQPYFNEKNKEWNVRPNSVGLRLFFGKEYEDMSPYLPGEKRFYKN